MITRAAIRALAERVRFSLTEKKVAEGPIGNTTPFLFSADETADVGTDGATPVTEDYAEGDNAFTGEIEKVTVELM